MKFVSGASTEGDTVFAACLSASRNDMKCHAAVLIQAVSKEEAIGIGYRKIHKLYPTIQGWSCHYVAVNIINSICTKDTELTEVILGE